MGSKKGHYKGKAQPGVSADDALFRLDQEGLATEWGEAHVHFYGRDTELLGIRLCVPAQMPHENAKALSDEIHTLAHEDIAAGDWAVGGIEVHACACRRETEPGSLLYRGFMWPLVFSDGLAALAPGGRDMCADFDIASHIPGWPSWWGQESRSAGA